MILADKIILLRKKNGWSQEELAEKMGVSRQAVSKWEGALSAPDLDKVLLLSQILGVSTDYLLKDDMEDPEFTKDEGADGAIRRVSLEEANAFLTVKEQTARHIALAVLLCALSPVCLMLLGAASESGLLAIDENAAAGLGVIVMAAFAAAAVALFIASGMKTSGYDYMEKEVFDTAYGVTGMAREKQRQYRDAYTRANIIAAGVGVLSVIPLFCGLFFEGDDMACAWLLCATFALAGLCAALFIHAGIRWASLQKLLQEGDYDRRVKQRGLPLGAISAVYWLVVTAGYLVYCFVTRDWVNSWIVWPVAGVLFAAVMTACSALQKGRTGKG